VNKLTYHLVFALISVNLLVPPVVCLVIMSVKIEEAEWGELVMEQSSALVAGYQTLEKKKLLHYILYRNRIRFYLVLGLSFGVYTTQVFLNTIHIVLNNNLMEKTKLLITYL